MTKTKSTLSEISGKAVGRNIILVIDGEKHSKAFPDKEERDRVLAMVDKYNKKHTKKGMNEVLEVMLKDSPKNPKEKVEQKIEEVKKTSKKAPKVIKAPEMTIAAAKKMLEKDGYTVTKKQPASHSGRRREY
jgi:hypothetical protein